MKTPFFLTFLSLFIFTQVHSQRSRGDNNRLGLQAKYALLDINTDSFTTQQGSGFSGGLAARSAFYNDFDLVFGIELMQADLSLGARESITATIEQVDYKLLAAQVNLQASYRIFGDHLSIEFGPAFMLNSNMELKDASHENHILDGYDMLQAKDVQEISRFNLNALVGLTAGFTNFRAVVTYQYGLLNTLNNLNRPEVENIDPEATGFEGNLSVITVGIALYL